MSGYFGGPGGSFLEPGLSLLKDMIDSHGKRSHSMQKKISIFNFLTAESLGKQNTGLTLDWFQANAIGELIARERRQRTSMLSKLSINFVTCKITD